MKSKSEDTPITIGLVVPAKDTTTRSGRDPYALGGPWITQEERDAATADCARDRAESPPRREVPPDPSAVACAFCGDSGCYDATPARTWTIDLKRVIASLNEHKVNAGATRYAYADERREWGWEFEHAKREGKISEATGPRRVVITRYVAAPPQKFKRMGKKASRLFDYGNFVGACKPMIDAMVKSKLLVDDDPANLRDHYRQVISDYESDYLRIEIVITDLRGDL